MRVQIQLLGEATFTLDGAPWRFTAPPKTLPLLCLLVTRAQSISRQSLAYALWPDVTASEARANLRRHLHALAKAMPDLDGVPWVLSDGQSVQWNPEAPAVIDVLEFREAAERDDAETAMRLYRGELLAGNLDEAIWPDRERLRTAYSELLTADATRALAERHYARARQAGEAMLALDEWREDALRIVMHARYRSGDRSGALASYERFAARLREDLRTDPTRETRELRDAIASGELLAHDDSQDTTTQALTPIVGRSAALEGLVEQWRRASKGTGSVAFVTGDAGIGKTRLVQELFARIRAGGGRTLSGRSVNPESTAFQPIAEVLRELTPTFQAQEHDDWLPALRPILPEMHWVSRLDDAEHVPELRLQEAVLRYLERCARQRPLAVALEDLHFARPATLELIGALAARLRALPILLVLTYRSSDVSVEGPVRSLRRALQRAGEGVAFALEPLTHADVEELVLRHDLKADPAFAASVYETSAGNPLFVWQLIRSRDERGTAFKQERLDIARAVLDRLKYLAPETRAVADVAATIGDRFTVEEIADIGGWPEAAVTRAVSELLERQLVSERAGISFEFGFTHAAIAGAIYDAANPDARTMHHRRAAEVLAVTRAEFGLDHALIAEHWLKSDERDNAREWYLHAAHQAYRAHARADAVLFAQRVLDLEPTPAQRFEALLLIVRSSARVQNQALGREALRLLFEMAEALGSDRHLTALAAAARFYSESGDRAAQVEAVETLARVASESEHAHWTAQASLELATLALQRGAAAAAESHLRAVDVAKLADANARVHYYATLAQALFRQTRFDDGHIVLAQLRSFLLQSPGVDGELAIADAETICAWVMESPAKLTSAAARLVDLAQARGDLLNEARGRGYLAYAKNQLHDTSGARDEYERIIDIYERSGHRQNVLITRTNYAMVEYAAGHVERAQKQWRLVEEEAASSGMAPETLTIAVSMNLGAIEIQRGDLQAALRRARFVFEAAEHAEGWILANAMAFYGEALCANGQTDEGLSLLDRALELLHETGRSAVEARTVYIESLVREKRVESLARVCEALIEEFERDPLDQLYPARTCWTLSQAYALLGDERERQRWIDRGEELLADRLESFTDEQDRAAYSASPFNRGFMKAGRCTYA